MVNGRPPDPIPRVQSGPDDLSESMEMEEEGDRFEVLVQSSHDQAQVRAHQNVPARVSYASMARNLDRENMRAHDGLDLDPDRVVVLDKDCVKYCQE
ncbi:hypothetical protein V6N13_001402 [Hibiscus sabdariffa]